MMGVIQVSSILVRKGAKGHVGRVHSEEVKGIFFIKLRYIHIVQRGRSRGPDDTPTPSTTQRYEGKGYIEALIKKGEGDLKSVISWSGTGKTSFFSWSLTGKRKAQYKILKIGNSTVRLQRLTLA